MKSTHDMKENFANIFRLQAGTLQMKNSLYQVENPLESLNHKHKEAKGRLR